MSDGGKRLGTQLRMDVFAASKDYPKPNKSMCDFFLVSFAKAKRRQNQRAEKKKKEKIIVKQYVLQCLHFLYISAV